MMKDRGFGHCLSNEIVVLDSGRRVLKTDLLSCPEIFLNVFISKRPNIQTLALAAALALTEAGHKTQWRLEYA